MSGKIALDCSMFKCLYSLSGGCKGQQGANGILKQRIEKEYSVQFKGIVAGTGKHENVCFVITEPMLNKEGLK